MITKSKSLKGYTNILLSSKNFNVDDVLTHEVLFPAWNLNKKIPTLFSKIMKEKNPDSEYTVSMNDMIFAS